MTLATSLSTEQSRTAALSQLTAQHRQPGNADADDRDTATSAEAEFERLEKRRARQHIVAQDLI